MVILTLLFFCSFMYIWIGDQIERARTERDRQIRLFDEGSPEFDSLKACSRSLALLQFQNGGYSRDAGKENDLWHFESRSCPQPSTRKQCHGALQSFMVRACARMYAEVRKNPDLQETADYCSRQADLLSSIENPDRVPKDADDLVFSMIGVELQCDSLPLDMCVKRLTIDVQTHCREWTRLYHKQG